MHAGPAACWTGEVRIRLNTSVAFGRRKPQVGSSMEFLATCSFLLDGVAHHTAGVRGSRLLMSGPHVASCVLGNLGETAVARNNMQN